MMIESVMLTTILKAAAGSALKYSFEELKARVNKAREAPSEALVCKDYFDIAKDALRALEREVDEILIETEYCDTSNKEEVRLLCKRIDEYLYISRIIFVLQDAVYGIETCQKALAENQDAFFAKIPYLTEDIRRKEAVEELENVLPNLRKCIDTIIDPGLSWFPGTGLRAGDLNDIKNKVQALAEPSKLAELVSSIRAKKINKNDQQGFAQYYDVMNEINRKLALAFRT
jgi:hypothetical protein